MINFIIITLVLLEIFNNFKTILFFKRDKLKIKIKFFNSKNSLFNF